jgi:hypothetical protein
MRLLQAALAAAVVSVAAGALTSVTAACQQFVNSSTCVLQGVSITLQPATEVLLQNLVLNASTLYAARCDSTPDCPEGTWNLVVVGSMAVQGGSRLSLSSTVINVTGDMVVDYTSSFDLSARAPPEQTKLSGGGANGGGGAVCGGTESSVGNPLIRQPWYFGGSSVLTPMLGARGGGRLRLVVGGQLVMQGSIAADGQSGSQGVPSSAGAGGTVVLVAGRSITLLPNGSISAVGGDCLASSYGGTTPALLLEHFCAVATRARCSRGVARAGMAWLK